MIRAGLIGYGLWAKNILRTLTQLDGVTLTAISRNTPHLPDKIGRAHV